MTQSIRRSSAIWSLWEPGLRAWRPLSMEPRKDLRSWYWSRTRPEGRRDEVVVVGGGNSAGQAAVFLAQTARRIHLLVRSSGLAQSMSRYLIRRLEQDPKIILRTQTEIVELEGSGQLERIRWRDNRTGA